MHISLTLFCTKFFKKVALLGMSAQKIIKSKKQNKKKSLNKLKNSL